MRRIKIESVFIVWFEVRDERKFYAKLISSLFQINIWINIIKVRDRCNSM